MHTFRLSLAKQSLAAALLFAATVVATSVATPVAAAVSDADLIAAKEAFDKGDRARLNQLAPRFAGELFEPYVSFWQLKLRLEDATPEEIRRYLARYPDTPLADRLRVDWLKALGRRGDWTLFAAEAPLAASDDVELACLNVIWRRQREGDAALAAAKPLWFSEKATPDACEPLFAALMQRGDLTSADRRARFRLATEAGNVRLAQAIGADMPGAERMTEREFAAIGRDPARALARAEFAFNTPAGRDLALYTLERVARSDTAVARANWVKVRERLPLPDRQYGNARLAFHAAKQLNPAANDWFREAGAVPLGNEASAWRVRAALRAVAWEDVATAIDAMPEAQRQESAWRYWRARAWAAQGKSGQAQAQLETLAGEANFYGILASEWLGRRFELPASTPLASDSAALAAFGSRPEVQRVRKLAELDMRPESLREWQTIVRGQSDDALLLAADYARRVGLYDRAINTAERTSSRHDYSLRYLAPFKNEFEQAARVHDVDVALLYGIARQESRFISDIVSSAGAVGLMQLMPGTAKWVAKQLNRADYRPAQISDVELNTQFGAYYFRYWYERLDRMPALAAAGYNAGPGRAQAWRPIAPLEGAIWVETIPFNETRDYVKKVLANAYIYTRAFNATPAALTTTLGTVAPRGAPALAASAAAVPR